MTKRHHRNSHPKYKKQYSIELTIVNRGDAILWFSEDIIESWSLSPRKQMGRPSICSDIAI